MPVRNSKYIFFQIVELGFCLLIQKNSGHSLYADKFSLVVKVLDDVHVKIYGKRDFLHSFQKTKPDVSTATLAVGIAVFSFSLPCYLPPPATLSSFLQPTHMIFSSPLFACPACTLSLTLAYASFHIRRCQSALFNLNPFMRFRITDCLSTGITIYSSRTVLRCSFYRC